MREAWATGTVVVLVLVLAVSVPPVVALPVVLAAVRIPQTIAMTSLLDRISPQNGAVGPVRSKANNRAAASGPYVRPPPLPLSALVS